VWGLLHFLQVKLRPHTTHAAAAEGSSVGAEAAGKQQQDPPANSQTTGGSGSSDSSSTAPIPWSCSEESLLLLIAARDPQGIGLEGGLALRLLQRLLAWDPSQRPTAAQALQHAYFTVVRQPHADPEEPARSRQNEQDENGDASVRDAKVFRAGKLVREPAHPQQFETRRRQQQGASRGQQQGARMHGEREAAAAAAVQAERVRALLQQQAAALQGCSSIPVGVPGWC
jgi:serine/threonine protein kinase